MPAQLSKFAIQATCKDFAHPWTNVCVSATAGLGLQAIQECLKIYSTFYFITLLTKGRIPTLTDLKRTIISILQSTAFLSWSTFTYAMFICSIRRMLGHFNILTVSFIPSFLSSFFAIVVERPSRRTMLTLYVSNIATETLFKMAVSRGYVSNIPHGEVYIFAAGLATLLYFYRSKNNTDSIFRLFRLGLGPYEEKGYQQRNNFETAQPSSSYTKSNSDRRKKPSNSILKLVWEALRVYKQLIDKLKMLGGKHTTCLHPNSCLYYTTSGGLKMFSIGYGIHVGLKLLLQMKTLIRKPKQLKEILFKKGALNLACFLGGFAGLYKFISCALRRARKKDSAEHALIAGLIASISFAMYPDNTIALYVAWKAVHLLWNDGVEKGIVPEVKGFMTLLYCFSTAVLFHALIVEPQNLRTSYFKFIYNLSGGRIAAMSRIPIDEFGFESNKHLQALLKQTKTTDKHVFIF